MKKIILLIVLLYSSLFNFAQLYNNKQNSELIFNGSITVDNVDNMSGGMQNGSALLSLFDLSLDYNFHNSFLRHTSFHGHILKTAGTSSSENFIGDAQVASNIDGRSTHFIYELLIKQKIGDFTIILGMHDLNSEFMNSNYAGDFINSSFGIAPTMSLNIPVSIFPTTTFGSLLSYNRKRISISSGFYNFNYKFIEEESFDYKNHFYQNGYLSINEFVYSWFKNELKGGELKFGGYFKQCVNYNSSNCLNDNNYGFYFISDQILKRFGSGVILGSFIQLGLTPKQINLASEYYGTGISIKEIPFKWLPNQF